MKTIEELEHQRDKLESQLEETEHQRDGLEFKWDHLSISLKKLQKWRLVPCARHFNIVRGNEVIYEGVTSELQGNRLIDAHNSTLR